MSRHGKKHSHRNEVTLGSGPFHIPTFNQSANANKRLIIIIKNHSKRTLQADVVVDACFPLLNDFTPPTEETSLPETTLATFPRTNIPGETCKIYEVAITQNTKPFINIFSTGDYNVINGRPAGGLLEISVVAGVGAVVIGGERTGLFFGEPVSFIPYGIWVIEPEDEPEDDC